ncbi:uncharacterized protein BO95DRAFT_516112 [Aspergillus brunneoviolaceus CBS 621.78]|uniref:Uncharacterized protein n=1 Tax=Aspergillus brunneoviolaceus CBS 621.78 TaxID=1450534 RepID=A0ACD1G3N1_9EURO|nr:hypothetical protein BO95DRAFT_516112 [Aspergillus brunneoviolaceus CBS 621.78]RAH43874.1 hypothetical protein BO95DRAFT_516112 [Aspergillus brunneoviolaceus CBS 621.78]
MLFVQAWPSTGRFMRKENPTPAELRYLGFDPSSSKLCEEAYFGDSLDICLRRFRQANYGWPSSGKGLWTWEYDAHPRRLKQEAEQRELLAALKGAQEMDEQCVILERLGLSSFYEDPADYLRLADLYRVRGRGRVYDMREYDEWRSW